MKMGVFKRIEIVFVTPMNLSRFRCLTPQNIIRKSAQASTWYLSVRQLFLGNIKHMLPCKPQNMPHKGETVDICVNVLWEPVTKTVHPKHN